MSFEKWVEIIDKIIFQAYYRVLSFVSIHAPIGEVYSAAEKLLEKRGGKLYWVVKDRIARWEDLDVNPPHKVKMSIWIFGSKIRGKNTVIARVGWWKLYVIDAATKTISKILGTY